MPRTMSCTTESSGARFSASTLTGSRATGIAVIEIAYDYHSIVHHYSRNIVTEVVIISSIYPSPSPNPTGGAIHLKGGA